MIIVLQFTGFAFSLTMIYFALLHYRRHSLYALEFIAWVIMWAGFLVIISFPDMFRSFSSTFLVTRLFDVLVISGIGIFSIMASMSYIRSRNTEKRVEELVRALSIRNAKKHQERKKEK